MEQLNKNNFYLTYSVCVIALLELNLTLDGFLMRLETLIDDSSNLKSILNFNGRLSFGSF